MVWEFDTLTSEIWLVFLLQSFCMSYSEKHFFSCTTCPIIVESADTSELIACIGAAAPVPSMSLQGISDGNQQKKAKKNTAVKPPNI